MAAISACSAPMRVTLSGIIVGAGAAIAGVVLGRLSGGVGVEEGGAEDCESCGGAGYVECMCMRWDYGGVSARAREEGKRKGCAKCRGSGRTRCLRCRGGGMRVRSMVREPIPVRVKGPFEL